MEDNFITKRICSTVGADDSLEVELVADTCTGKTRLVVTKTFTERYELTDYKKVMELYDKLNNARRIYRLKDFI